MTEYVLIYNGSGVGPKSRDDLKHLFEAYKIYPSVDVRFTTFDHHFDGLSPKETTIILPGGTVFGMAASLFPKREKIKDFFKRGCNGVFVCAGAYLATRQADIFHNQYHLQPDGNFKHLPYGFSLSSEDNLNIVSDYQAMGPFIPHDAYRAVPSEKRANPMLRKPYCVTLRNSLDNNIVSQMYAGGPDFKSVTEHASERYQVVYTYRDCSAYSFFRPNESSQDDVKSMPAMIRAKEQGLFLSGTHFETCVENSQLLKLMREGDEDTIPLPGNYHYDPTTSQEAIIPLLKESLRRKMG